MLSGSAPVWVKPKYIIHSPKCKLLLHQILKPSYLRVPKQYQMVTVGWLEFAVSLVLPHVSPLAVYWIISFSYLSSWLNIPFLSCSGLVQFFMVSLGGSPQQCTGEANCWVAWTHSGNFISQSALFSLPLAEVHYTTCFAAESGDQCVGKLS